MSRLSRAAGLVSAATLISRVLGLCRDALRAALVGASRVSDALDVAFKVPNLLRDLFAEGAFSGAFVPTLARVKEARGHDAAFEAVNRVLSTMLVYVGGITALLAWSAPALVRLLTAPEFASDPRRFETAVSLVRVLAPFLLLVCLAVVAMGALNVCGRFFLPALSPASQNLVLVAGGLALVWSGVREEAAALPWALLLLAGGAMQFAVQIPALRREGWRPRFSPDLALRSPEVREILRRMAPVLFGLAATHVSVLVNLRLATEDVGGPSYLYYGFRLVHLPVGLVGVAVGTVALAEASRRAARGDGEGVRGTLGEALRVCFALSLPAAAGLAVLGEPISRLLYEWGETTPAEAAAIGDAIRLYALAVVFYSCVKVVVPVFYAAGRLRPPLVAALAGVAGNIAVAVGLHPVLGWRALALAVGVGQMLNLAVLLVAARRAYGGPAGGLAAPLARIAAATAACALAAAGVLALLPEGDGGGIRSARALLPVAAGIAAYLAAGRALGSPEVDEVRHLLRLDKTVRKP